MSGCPLEDEFAAICVVAGLEAVPHDTVSGLDFYLPSLDTYVEIKRYHSDRIARQMARQENVIAIQGVGALRAFARLVGVRWLLPRGRGVVTKMAEDERCIYCGSSIHEHHKGCWKTDAASAVAGHNAGGEPVAWQVYDVDDARWLNISKALYDECPEMLRKRPLYAAPAPEPASRPTEDDARRTPAACPEVEWRVSEETRRLVRQWDTNPMGSAEWEAADSILKGGAVMGRLRSMLAEIDKARAALARRPGGWREGWIAGRDAAADNVKIGRSGDREMRSYAEWFENQIRALAPPADAPDGWLPMEVALVKPCREMSYTELLAVHADLAKRWSRLQKDLDESGGSSGSPGEWIVERSDEIAAELKRRGFPAPPADNEGERG